MRRSAGSRREPAATGARSQVRRGCSGAAYRQAGFIGCPRSQTIREDFIMGVKLGFLVTLEAKDGKGEELGEFLRAGREFAAAEEQTITWYAFRIDATHYGIFDTFASEDGRQAHIAGPLAEALGKAADELLASEPSIRPVDVIAVK
jgi:quinol monooxygenase YgiN